MEHVILITTDCRGRLNPEKMALNPENVNANSQLKMCYESKMFRTLKRES